VLPGAAGRELQRSGVARAFLCRGVAGLCLDGRVNAALLVFVLIGATEPATCEARSDALQPLNFRSLRRCGFCRL